MAELRITHYTDPGCPFAFSAEPFRWRLQWLYGDTITWHTRMVGLAAKAEDYAKKGLTPEMIAGAQKSLGEQHGMPFDPDVKPRIAGTLPACRAVVAAHLHAPETQDALLRNLRVRHFSGELLDEQSTIDDAARDAGIDPEQLRAWVAGDDVQEALDADLHASRHPTPEALALDARLADWEGGRRYTCPSMELEAGDERLSAPGFQPFAVYDVATANLLPTVQRRPDPEHCAEVLAWAGTPLSTQEVAVVRGISPDEAREELRNVATLTPVGDDGYWSLTSAG